MCVYIYIYIYMYICILFDLYIHRRWRPGGRRRCLGLWIRRPVRQKHAVAINLGGGMLLSCFHTTVCTTDAQWWKNTMFMPCRRWILLSRVRSLASQPRQQRCIPNIATVGETHSRWTPYSFAARRDRANFDGFKRYKTIQDLEPNTLCGTRYSNRRIVTMMKLYIYVYFLYLFKNI